MADEVEKFLTEKQQLETRRQELIKEVLRQKEAANKAFDEKLAKLGHNENYGAKRSHHKARGGKGRRQALRQGRYNCHAGSLTKAHVARP